MAGRLLGVEKFGELALILSLGMLASTLPATGFPQALLWKIGGGKERLENTFFASLIGVLALMIIAFIPILLIAGLPNLVLLIILADSATYLYLNLQMGLLDYKKVAKFSSARNIIKMVILGILWAAFPDMEWEASVIVIIYLFAPFITILCLEIKMLRINQFTLPEFDEELFKELRNYALPLIGSAATLAILLQGDVVFLEHYHGEKETGPYFAAKRLLIPILLLPVAARGLLIPSLSGSRIATAQLKKLIIYVMGFSAIAAASVGLAGPWFLELLYGDEFSVDVRLTLIIAGAAFILAGHELVTAILLGHGHSLKVFITHLFTMVVALTLFQALIPEGNAEEAGLALLIGSIFALAMNLMWTVKLRHSTLDMGGHGPQKLDH